jgi:hypothetical protein
LNPLQFQRVVAHRPDIIQNPALYEAMMTLDLLLAQLDAGVPQMEVEARKWPVDPVLIEELVYESWRRPSFSELEILCASGAQFIFSTTQQKKEKKRRSSYRVWKGVVCTRLLKALCYKRCPIFLTPAQAAHIITFGLQDLLLPLWLIPSLP